jgi:hypothetical protein
MQETVPVLCHPTAYSPGSEYMSAPFLGLTEILSLRIRCLNSNIVVKQYRGCDL